jgi:hypothetical protein
MISALPRDLLAGIAEDYGLISGVFMSVLVFIFQF